MRRLPLLGFLSLSVSFACAQVDLQQKVSVEANIRPLAEVLAQVSASSGLTVTAVPELHGDRMLLRVADMPLESLLNAIAKATSAKWEKKESGWSLLPDRAAQLKVDQGVLKQRIAAINKNIADKYKALNAPPEIPTPAADEPKMTPEEEKEFREMMNASRGSNPEAQLLSEALRQMDPRVLAGIRPGDRVVFTATPTRMQVFSGVLTPLLPAFYEAYNKQAKVDEEAERARANEPVDDATSQMLNLFGNMRPQSRSVLKSPCAKVILVVSPQGMMPPDSNGYPSTLSVELFGFDAKGEIKLRGADALMVGESYWGGMIDEEMLEGVAVPTSDSATPVAAPPRDKKAPVADHPVVAAVQDAPLEVSEILKQFRSATTMTDPAATMSAVIPEELRKRLMKPTQFDPLSFEVGDAWLQVGKKQNWQIVASVTEYAPMSFGANRNGGKMKDFVRRYVRSAAVDATLDAGTLVISPKNPAAARSERLDRGALESLITASGATGFPGVDALAEYAAVNPNPMQTPTIMPYFLTVIPGLLSMDMMSAPTTWETLGLFGSLGKSQRDTLMKGGRVPFSQLAGAQLANMKRMVYGPNNQIRETDDKESDSPFPFAFMGGAGAQRTTFRNEPTELLPNGLPPEGYVELKNEDQDMVTLAGEGAAMSRAFGAFGADEMAFFRMMLESPEAAQAMGGMTFDKFRVGQRSRLTFFFYLAPKVFIRSSVNHDRLDPKSAVVGYDKLPERFKNEVKKRRDKFKSFEDMMKRNDRGGESAP
jgi:hypothetical protein